MLLIIDKTLEDALGISDMFFYIGIPSTAIDYKSALSENYDVYSAIIIINPENTKFTEEILAKLVDKKKSTPIFALCDDKEYIEKSKGLFSKILDRATYSPRLYNTIATFTKENNINTPGVYILGNINASLNLASTLYNTDTIPFTKTENMILRVLIRFYGKPITSSEILKHAFRQSRAPELSNVRTHISIMNKKFKSKTNKNLIKLSLGKGYELISE